MTVGDRKAGIVETVEVFGDLIEVILTDGSGVAMPRGDNLPEVGSLQIFSYTGICTCNMKGCTWAGWRLEHDDE